MANCVMCNMEVSDKARTCSPRCRVALSRRESVTAEQVSVTEPQASVTFQFTVVIGPNDEERGLVEQKNKVREAKYWYDVPLAAVPVLLEGWPPMPSYMNGRQYFLWWKNNFAVNEDGSPLILDPLAHTRGALRYQDGGQGSRMWGA